MYSINPLGINIKQNDRKVPDGFLQESINMQWRDGAYRPIPERLSASISDTSGKDEIILHKVSDEDQINVLMFDAGVLKWFGQIDNGVYTAKSSAVTITDFPTVTDFEALSFTILNGLVYFMSTTDEFYYRLEYNDSEDVYEVRNMYEWKNLISFYESAGTKSGFIDQGDADRWLVTRCGIIAYRFTLVLETGEEVLPSPIYVSHIYSLNLKNGDIEEDETLSNIHTIVNTNTNFATGTDVSQISAINVYATVPFYKTVTEDEYTSTGSHFEDMITRNEERSEVKKMAEQTFHLVNTFDTGGLNQNSDKNIIFYAGSFRLDYTAGLTNSISVNMDTIAAGQTIPNDSFSYHSLFGKIRSYNNRLNIQRPKVILSKGNMRALAISSGTASKVGYETDTEDGNRRGVAFEDTAAIEFISSTRTRMRGLLSYPDSRAIKAGGGESLTSDVRLFNLRENEAFNMSCAFDFAELEPVSDPTLTEQTVDSVDQIRMDFDPTTYFIYGNGSEQISNPDIIDDLSYLNENRLQFSAAGEFTVWPAANSHRVGSGRIQFVGDNNVDPSNSDYIAPLIIGTTEGVYTVNFDTTGATLIQSITKTANIPAVSEESIQIDQHLIYVSDKGLMTIVNGQLDNLTDEFFPQFGNGGFPVANTVYPNYNVLTSEIFGGNNPYVLTDIIDYLKGAIFAYDARRENLWCSNSNRNYSLIYNSTRKQWDVSTYVFSKVVDLFAFINSNSDSIYSRFLTLNSNGNLDILSGENNDVEVFTHLLTRPIKLADDDSYIKVQRLIARCELYRNTSSGFFAFGMWGKQDINKDKVNIPLVAIKDNTSANWPNNIRQDIPIGRHKGKYKTITMLHGGKMLPTSSIDVIDFEVDT